MITLVIWSQVPRGRQALDNHIAAAVKNYSGNNECKDCGVSFLEVHWKS